MEDQLHGECGNLSVGMVHGRELAHGRRRSWLEKEPAGVGDGLSRFTSTSAGLVMGASRGVKQACMGSRW